MQGTRGTHVTLFVIMFGIAKFYGPSQGLYVKKKWFQVFGLWVLWFLVLCFMFYVFRLAFVLQVASYTWC